MSVLLDFNQIICLVCEEMNTIVPWLVKNGIICVDGVTQ